MSVPRISVVVPTYNRCESVVRLLRALGEQTVAPELFEAVIVIDGSRDGTGEAIDACTTRFGVRYVWQSRHGRAAACNAGARLAGGDILLFLDDDMEPAQDLVRAHLTRHDAKAKLGVVGAVPIVPAADAPPLVTYRATTFDRKMERLAGKRDALTFTHVYTGNFSIPRDIFIAVGGYDEEFRRYGHEDYELALRLERAGVRFVFDQDAMAVQHYTNDLRALAANVEAEGETAVLLAIKHPEALDGLQLSRYARRSQWKRTRLGVLLMLSRTFSGFLPRLIAATERLERRSVASDYDELFARYDLLFDVVYWLGVERALRRRTRFKDIGRSVAAAR